MSREEQIKAHQQKWKRWNQERKKEKIHKDLKAEQNLHKYVVNITQKLAQPGEKRKNMEKDKEIVNKLGYQIESNLCSICLQLMVPPQIPMILFPCGHNICKMCLFVDADKKRQKYKLKIDKCPNCRQKINNYAQNRNLMALICTYTNNKDLLQKELAEEEEEKQQNYDDIYQLRVRCQVLTGEKNVLDKDLAVMKKEKNILNEVVDKLNEEKKKNRREIEKLEEEGKLIQNYLDEKQEELEAFKKKINYTEEKKRIIENTLQPLNLQKQKLEMLEAAKLISKKD